MQRTAGGSLGLLTFIVAGCEQKLTPAAAKSSGVPLRTLSSTEAHTLDALGEILLPGCAAAGLTHYIDHQLSGPAEDSMLILKYLGVSPPFLPFYRGGLAGAAASARRQYGRTLAELDAEHGVAFVSALAGGKVMDWSGPPAALFYFALRSDAIDAMYGTQEGFHRLGVPYMAHIPPASRWGE
jgi:hypothetical protein